jgi:hypothetical protein
MISVVISYCSNDKEFIQPLLSQCRIFSDDIIVVSTNHFLNGKIDLDLDDLTSDKVTHIIYPWEADKNPKFWHNHNRFVGLQNSKNKHILFLDADEIPNGALMLDFLNSGIHESVPIVSFECYWYFREPTHRALTTERCGVLYDRSYLTEELIYHPMERWSFEMTQTARLNMFKFQGEIIMHHFSWVRTKEQMLKKVKSWAHQGDKQWVSLIEEEFKYPFKGRDFVHNYKFTDVENIFNIDIYGRQETTSTSSVCT